MSYQATYIPDGYTLNGYIKEVSGKHGDLLFKYRPLLAKERAVISSRLKNSTPEISEDESAKLLALKVQEWDLRHPETGAAIEITPQELSRLQPSLLARLFGIVTGWEPTDIHPDWTKQERRDTTDDAYDRVMQGQSLEDREAKNSSAG
ncbi:MAG: hypothetical protein ACF8CY_05335 [Gimesia chilikensis]